MRSLAVSAVGFLFLGVSVAIGGCAASSASPPRAQAPATLSTSSQVPASPSTAAAATSATAPAAPTPPSPTSAAQAAIPATPTARPQSLAELLAKAAAAPEYKYELRSTGAEVGTGKVYVKGAKVRQELSAQGLELIVVMDSATKSAFTLLPDERQAMKLDYALAFVRTPRYDSLVGAQAKLVGTEIVDGKMAAIYDQAGELPGKFWLWIERGLPLKAELPAGGAKQVVEFLNYQFGPQPDNLFEIPAGYQVAQAPAGLAIGAGAGAPPAAARPTAVGAAPSQAPVGLPTVAPAPKGETQANAGAPAAGAKVDTSVVPAELADLPIPAGLAFKVGSARRLVREDRSFSVAQAIWTGPGEAEEAGAFYRDTMPSLGWTQESFVESLFRVDAVFWIQKENRYVLTIEIESEDDEVTVKLDLERMD